LTEPARKSTEQRKEQTERELVAAATEVFARRGYQAATLDEVADAAGFTKGAIYAHFDTKEELFLAAMRGRQESMIEAFFGAGESAPRESNHVNAMTAVFERLAPTPTEWTLWQEFQLYALRNPHVRERLEVNIEMLLAAVIENTRIRWETLGVEPPVPIEKLARLYIAIFDGLLNQRSTNPDAVHDELFGELITAIDEAFIAAAGP